MVRRERRRWRTFPTTADVGLAATAGNPAALFEALALGIYSLLTDLRRVRPSERRRLEARGIDPPSLLVAFLNELLVLRETHRFVGRKVSVRLIGRPPTALQAEIYGERFSPERHRERWEVKAVTFHRLELDLHRGRARVIVDL